MVLGVKSTQNKGFRYLKLQKYADLIKDLFPFFKTLIEEEFQHVMLRMKIR